jgi:hypothetical protein
LVESKFSIFGVSEEFSVRARSDDASVIGFLGGSLKTVALVFPSSYWSSESIEWSTDTLSVVESCAKGGVHSFSALLGELSKVILSV